MSLCCGTWKKATQWIINVWTQALINKNGYLHMEIVPVS